MDYIQVSHATGVKCPRCWHYHWATLNFGHEEGHKQYPFEKLCNTCVAIILKYYKEHESYPFILENLDKRGIKPEDNPEWNNV